MFSLKLYAAMDNELCAGFLIFLHLNSIYQRVAILHFSTFSYFYFNKVWKN